VSDTGKRHHIFHSPKIQSHRSQQSIESRGKEAIESTESATGQRLLSDSAFTIKETPITILSKKQVWQKAIQWEGEETR
jgi:hypothetical protein